MLIQGGADPRGFTGGLKGLSGDNEYAGASEPAGPTPSGPSNVTGQELLAIQQKNEQIQIEHAKTQANVNWIVGGVVVLAVVGGIYAFMHRDG